MNSKIIILFLLLCFQIQFLQAQNCKKLKTLLDQGIEEQQNRNYAHAYEILTKVAYQAEKAGCHKILWDAKNTIGTIYYNLSSYAQSLDYYQQALFIAKKYREINKKRSVSLNNIAILYSAQGNYIKAIQYYEDSYALSKKYNYDFAAAINMANLYTTMGELDKAKNYLEEVRGKIEEEEYKPFWKRAYAELLYLEGDTERAIKITEGLFLESQKDKKGHCNVCVLKLLSKIYAGMAEYDRAIEFAKKGLENASMISSRIDFYERLAHVYSKKEHYREASLYKDSTIIAKDSLSGIINQHLFQVNRIKFEVQEYQNHIKQNLEQHRAERIMFFILMGFGLSALFFIFKILKNRVVRQKQKRAIAEKKQKITTLRLENEKNERRLLEEQSKTRQEKLKNKISGKNRKLAANALYYSGRNELLEKIISSLTSITSISQNKAVKDYIEKLKENLNIDSKWEDFVFHFEKVNPGFLKKLKAEHPQLTKKDIRFVCYIYMNLSTKEVCAIFDITPKTFWKRRERLSEKMGLEKSGLYDYILNLV